MSVCRCIRVSTWNLNGGSAFIVTSHPTRYVDKQNQLLTSCPWHEPLLTDTTKLISSSMESSDNDICLQQVAMTPSAMAPEDGAMATFPR